MSNRFDKPFLHKVTKQGNLMEPYSDYITEENFPEQNSELIGSIVSITYRDQLIADQDRYNDPAMIRDHHKKMISSRPKDDIPFLPIDLKSGDDNIVYTKDFRILRADISKPYRYIGVSLDYNLLIAGWMNPETKSIDLSRIPIATEELDAVVGLRCHIRKNKFSLESDEGIVIGSNAVEPSNTIIVDMSDQGLKFIFSDEVWSEIYGYATVKTDKDEKDHLENIDIDPKLEYTLYPPKDRTIIQKMRRMLLEGKFLYGQKVEEDKKDEENEDQE